MIGAPPTVASHMTSSHQTGVARQRTGTHRRQRSRQTILTGIARHRESGNHSKSIPSGIKETTMVTVGGQSKPAQHTMASPQRGVARRIVYDTRPVLSIDELRHQKLLEPHLTKRRAPAWHFRPRHQCTQLSPCSRGNSLSPTSVAPRRRQSISSAARRRHRLKARRREGNAQTASFGHVARQRKRRHRSAASIGDA
jgi:hypothetical protein